MKKILLLFTILINILANAQIVYQKYEKENIVEKANFLKDKFNPKYLLIGDFLPVKKGSKIKLAKVFTNAGWGYIDEKGNEIIESRHKRLGYFKDGLAIGERIVDNPKFKGNFITKKYLYNASGLDLAKNDEIFKDFSETDWYGEDYLHLEKNNEYPSRGIISKEGKILVPMKYDYVMKFRNHFFAFSSINNTSDLNLKKVEVYTLTGKFLKSFISQEFSAYQDQLVVHHFKGSYFINNETFEKLDDRIFENINEVKGSKKFKLSVEFYDKNTKTYTDYLLDENLQIFNPNFPNSFSYNDEFLVQVVSDKERNPVKMVLWNFNKEKIAEYTYDDFATAEYFGAGKLSDTNFINSHLKEWRKLKRGSRNYELPENNYQPKSYRLKSFYEENSFERTIAFGYADSDKGKIISKYNNDDNDVKNISLINNTNLFQILYEDPKKGLSIIDETGKTLINYVNTKDINTEITDIYGMNHNSANFLTVYKIKDTLGYYKMRYPSVLSLKDFKPIMEKPQSYFSPYFSDEDVEYFYFINDKKLVGIIDKNRKILFPQKYVGFSQSYPAVSTTILKPDDNTVMILEKKNLNEIIKIQFSPGILKNATTVDGHKQYRADPICGAYNSGFYLFNEDRLLMDLYGNIIDTPPDFTLYEW